MPLTFIHTADWQLGKPYARVGDIAKRSRLQNERFMCLKRIGDCIKKTGASFVVVAGDLFDSPSPVDSTVAKACEAIGAMEVPVLVIPGNHDHGGPGSLWEQPFFKRHRDQLAPNLRVILTPEAVALADAVIFPAPLLRRQDLADPSVWIRDAFHDLEIPSDLPRIVLAHGSVQGFESASQADEDEDAGANNRIDLSRLPMDEIDYIALGDWHGTKQVGPKEWYSGTPEIDRFPKGSTNFPGNVLLVSAMRAKMPQVESISTGGLRWNELSFLFSGDDSFTDFRSQLNAIVGQWGQDSLLKLVLEGSLGIEASGMLEAELKSLDARLLRLKLEDRVTIAPTESEVEALAASPHDPLIAAVARKLIELTHSDSATATLALRELHAACMTSPT